MQRTVLIFFLFIAIFQPIYAQYTALECSGELPKDFYQSSTDKYLKEIASIDKSTRGSDKRNQKEFFLESNFVIDDLLQSGYVLFNDPISAYIQEVARVVLKDDEALFNKLQFYAVRSSAVNAFAINQGIVFVNIGLLAQLENEAQLAFILAHEIAHVVKKHGLEFYLEKKNIEQSSNQELLKRTNYDDKVLATNRFSQGQEIEADSLGLLMFSKTPYTMEAIQEVFDILQFSYLPFEDIAFDKSFFEDDYLSFPSKFAMLAANAINLESNDDENTTHPSIDKRKVLTKNFRGAAAGGKEEFVMDSAQFSTIREIARKELLNYNLRDNNYYRAIYNAYLVLQESPDDYHAQKIIGKALYAMSALHNAGDWEEMRSDQKDVEGEISQLHHFVNELSAEELAVLAFRYNFLLSQKHSDDPELMQILSSASQDLRRYHSDLLSRMKPGRPPVDDPAQQPKVENEEKDKPLSKMDKIKANMEVNNEFYIHAFGDILETDTYKSLMNQELKDTGRDAEEKANAVKSTTAKRHSTPNNNSLGLNRVLVFNPFYKKFGFNFEREKFLRSEKAQESLEGIIRKNAAIADLKVDFLDVNNLRKKDVDKFNDIRHLNEWISASFAYDKDVNLIAYNQAEANAIAEKYKVDAVLLMGIVNGKVPKGTEIAAMFFYSPPAFLYSIFTPKGETAIFSIVLDLKTGKPLMETFDVIGEMDNNDILNQRVYEIVRQVSRKPKK